MSSELLDFNVHSPDRHQYALHMYTLQDGFNLGAFFAQRKYTVCTVVEQMAMIEKSYCLFDKLGIKATVYAECKTLSSMRCLLCKNSSSANVNYGFVRIRLEPFPPLCSDC